MPVSYSILSDRDLAVIVYEGEVSAAERAAAVSDVIGHRNFRSDHMHLVDLSGVTGWEVSLENAVLPGEVRMDWMRRQTRETLCVYYAPTEQGRALARILARAWDGIPGVVPLVLDDEAEALAILGQTEMRVAELPRAA